MHKQILHPQAVEMATPTENERGTQEALTRRNAVLAGAAGMSAAMLGLLATPQPVLSG